MLVAFKIPGACHTDLDSENNTITVFITNKNPKENPNKNTFGIHYSGCKKTNNNIEAAALTVMLAEGKADPKLFFVKKICHVLNFFPGF